MKNGLAIINTKTLFLFEVRHPFEVTLFYGTYLWIGSGQVQAKNRKKIERSRTYTIPVLCTIVHITYPVLFFSITKRSAFLLKHYYGIGILLSSYNAGTGTYLNAMKLTLKSFFLKNKHRSDLNTIIKLNSVLRSRSRPF